MSSHKVRVLGCDPGKTGAACLIYEDGTPEIHPFGKDDSVEDILMSIVEEWVQVNTFGADRPGEIVPCDGRSSLPAYGFSKVNFIPLTAYVEQVSSSPQMGVSSSFAFGRSYQSILSTLYTLKVPVTLVRPQQWQKGIPGLPTGKENQAQRKRALKHHAEMRYPGVKLTLATADSLLIADYGRRTL